MRKSQRRWGFCPMNSCVWLVALFIFANSSLGLSVCLWIKGWTLWVCFLCRSKSVEDDRRYVSIIFLWTFWCRILLSEYLNLLFSVQEKRTCCSGAFIVLSVPMKGVLETQPLFGDCQLLCQHWEATLLKWWLWCSSQCPAQDEVWGWQSYCLGRRRRSRSWFGTLGSSTCWQNFC